MTNRLFEEIYNASFKGPCVVAYSGDSWPEPIAVFFDDKSLRDYVNGQLLYFDKSTPKDELYGEEITIDSMKYDSIARDFAGQIKYFKNLEQANINLDEVFINPTFEDTLTKNIE